jgi:hypothetical protein
MRGAARVVYCGGSPTAEAIFCGEGLEPPVMESSTCKNDYSVQPKLSYGGFLDVAETHGLR